MIFRSKEMQKSFNFPYQCGYGQNGDDLKYLFFQDHEIMHNDIVVMGSDGLFDNVFDK